MARATQDDLHYIYGLRAASHELSLRYVGRTSHPKKRLKQHCELIHHSLVNAWCHVMVTTGDRIEMVCLAIAKSKSDAAIIEQIKIASFATTDLLNGQSWYTAQYRAGVPRSVAQAYKMSLLWGLKHEHTGDDRTAHGYFQIMRTLQLEYMKLNVFCPLHRDESIRDLSVLAAT